MSRFVSSSAAPGEADRSKSKSAKTGPASHLFTECLAPGFNPSFGNLTVFVEKHEHATLIRYPLLKSPVLPFGVILIRNNRTVFKDASPLMKLLPIPGRPIV